MLKFTIYLCVLLLFLNCDFNTGKAILFEGEDDIISNLDPATSEEVSESQIISCIYESLIQLGVDYHTLQPEVAEEWEISGDLRKFRFRLKSGIRFHDGSPLNADAVDHSFQRQITLNSSSPLFNMIEHIEVLDSLNLEIQLKYPYAQFLYTLASPFGLKIISKSALEKYGNEIATHPVGSGPFMVKEFLTNQRLHLTANPHYRSSSGQAKEVVIKCYNDYFSLEKDFREQKLDLIYAVPGFSIDRLKWQGRIEYQILPPLNVIFLGFNCRQPPFSDPRVRTAVLKAININELVNIVYRGKSLQAKSPVPPRLFDTGTIQQAAFNLQEAKELLGEAGYPDGFSAKFFYLDRLRPRRTLIEAIEFNLQQLNINLEMIPFYSWSELNEACRSDSAQLIWNSWQADVAGDPENFLYSLFYSSSQFNFFQYRNPDVDHWLELSRLEPHPEKRQILYRKIVQQIVEDTPAVFVFHVIPVFAYNRQKIKELPLNPYGMVRYNQIVLN